MIHLLFIGDGPRDHATVPHLVERILDAPVRPALSTWARLHRLGSGSGFSRKLRFATLQAQEANTNGLVLTVDADRDPARRKLKELRNAREAQRTQHPRFPTALGEAAPHGEAWLLDDPAAVSQALHLDPNTSIPGVSNVRSPKAALETLIQVSSRANERVLEVLADISRLVDPDRYMHANETGFRSFAVEVRHELGPVSQAIP
jgi:hypothetical protein